MTIKDLFDQMTVQGEIQISVFDDDYNENVLYAGNAESCDYINEKGNIKYLFAERGVLHIELEFDWLY